MISPKLNKIRSIKNFGCSMLLLTILPTSILAQDVISPPSIGQNTQGDSVDVIINSDTDLIQQETNNTPEIDTSDDEDSGLLGTTHISELRGENGRVYRIELEHSSGSKQTIEEFGSTRNIESTNTDIEDTPNLAKWKLGSW